MHKNKLRKGLQRWKKIKRYSEIEGESEREIEDIRVTERARRMF